MLNSYLQSLMRVQNPVDYEWSASLSHGVVASLILSPAWCYGRHSGIESVSRCSDHISSDPYLVT